MKETKQIRLERKIRRETWKASLGISGIAAIMVGALYLIYNPPASPEAKPEQEIESYIRSHVVETPVCPGREPVALYYQHPGMNHELFCCVGTISFDKEYGITIITAEHIFRTDLHTPQTISVKPLRKSCLEPTYYVNQIVKTSKDFGGQDAVMATFGTEPTIIQPFSSYIHDEYGKNYYGDVIVHKTKVPTLRSLVSSETIRTIGYCRRGEGTNGPIFIMIEYHSRPGESGTGFIDDQGGLYVLHTALQEPLFLF